MSAALSVAELAEGLRDLVARGGFVMLPLVVATLVLWYALGYRLVALRRGWRGSLDALLATPRCPGGVLGEAARRARVLAARRPAELGPLVAEALGELERDLGRFRPLVRSIVTVAPLAGLLGTVAGMIETFDALGDRALFARTGGVAGGISQALLTTQMGLAVAVPGIVVGRLLDRRERALAAEVRQLGERVVAVAGR